MISKLVNLLVENNLMISIAECPTAGRIQSVFTSNVYSSSVFSGGVSASRVSELMSLFGHHNSKEHAGPVLAKLIAKDVRRHYQSDVAVSIIADKDEMSERSQVAFLAISVFNYEIKIKKIDLSSVLNKDEMCSLISSILLGCLYTELHGLNNAGLLDKPLMTLSDLGYSRRGVRGGNSIVKEIRQKEGLIETSSGKHTFCHLYKHIFNRK